MSGGTERNVSSWTTDSLKEYLERRLDDLERRYEQRFEDTQLAISKAETAHEKRFDSVNEFRNAMSDQQKTFLPKSEYDRAHSDLIGRVESSVKAITEKIDELAARMNRNEGRTGGLSDGWKFLIAAVGLIATLATLLALWKH